MDPDDGTAPLDDAFAETVEHHNRVYQQYALTNKTYFSPIDSTEITRLEIAHMVFSRVFDNRTVFPPIKSPRKILDLGCGSGEWALEVAKQFPNAEVLGIDVSPHMMPDECPDNLEFQIDDLNKDFTFRSNQYDLVHSQMLVGGIDANRWQLYLRDILDVIRPGGWCQMVEIYFRAQSDNGMLTSDNALSKWSEEYAKGMHPFKDPRAPQQLQTWMRNAGFVEVESRLITLPMCGWSKNPREREIGQANVENIRKLLYSMALYPMTGLNGMDLDEFEQLVEDARKEAVDPSVKAYFPLYVCIGKKP